MTGIIKVDKDFHVDNNSSIAKFLNIKEPGKYQVTIEEDKEGLWL